PLAAGWWVERRDLVGRDDQLVERIAQHADRRSDYFGQGAAARADHGRAREQRFDRGQPERLVPLRRHPEAAGARQQHRLAFAVDFTDVLHRAGEGGPPAARNDELPAGALRGFHGPLIAPVAVQLAEKQIPLLLAAAKDVLGGVESVVDEDRTAVALGVIA